MGKRVIHDTEMTIDEETGVLTVRFPGWREDPTREHIFTPGDGTEFPLPDNHLTFEEDGTITKETDEIQAGITFRTAGYVLGLGPAEGGEAFLNIKAQGTEGNDSTVLVNVNGADIASFVDDGVQKHGIFTKAATPAAQGGAIADAVDAATTQAGLNSLLAVVRAFGYIAT
jgi:hypothetical protein